MDLTFISVDVETSGPSPAEHALLAIGACDVGDDDRSFYVELRPDRPGVDPEALAVSGLSLDRLRAEGVPAAEAMVAFAEWVELTAGATRPVLVALNAPFDWMFVADYLHRHVGRNPFGHSALDMKALYMGVSGAPWPATSLRDIAARYDLDVVLPHHALQDAVRQAEVFRALVDEVRSRGQDRPVRGHAAD